MTKSGFKELLEDVLRVPLGGLSESDSRESVETWSSLADVEILAVISSEFGIDAETFEYDTVGELMRELEDRNAFTA